MPSRCKLPPAACLALSLLLQTAAPLLSSAPALAGDLDGQGTVFLRFSLAPDGNGVEVPVLGLRVGPDFGGGRPGTRIVSRKPSGTGFDTAFAVEMNGTGLGRLRFAGFSWAWRLGDIVPDGWARQERLAADSNDNKMPNK